MKTAIVIIDMQNDFIHKNGSLCVPNGNKAAKNIANFLKENDVDKIFVSRDYHPKNNIASIGMIARTSTLSRLPR